jgi:hypothetical protein
MVEYREWCEENLPEDLGFKRAPARRRLDAILKKRSAIAAGRMEQP